MGSPVVAASPRKSPSSGRRTNKPLVEKKRRARINGCLGQLKSLILSAMQTEGAQASRLEKADILELTVKYLRHIQRQQVTAAVTSEPEVVAKFSAGYTECATEVIRYMDSAQCVTPEVRTRLESHLVERLRGSVPTPTGSAPSVVSGSAASTCPVTQHVPVSSSAYAVCNSSTTITSEEMSRHYQTALDLANMAAAVTAKDAAVAAAAAQAATCHANEASSLSPESSVFAADSPARYSVQARLFERGSRDSSDARDTVRSQSISPSSMGQRSEELLSTAMIPSSPSSSTSSLSVCDTSCEARRRHSSSEPILSSSFSSSLSLSSSSSSPPSSTAVVRQAASMQLENMNNDINNNYAYNNKGSRNSSDNLDVTVAVSNSSIDYHSSHLRNSNDNNSDYLSAFQRPLHIHIPDSPLPPTSPSPPFLHPQVTYPHPHGPILIPSTTTTSSSAAAPPPSSTRHGLVVDDAPPTILYPCDGYLMTGQANLSPHSAQQYVFRATPSGAQYENRNMSHSAHCNRNPKFLSNNNSNNSESGKENNNIDGISSRYGLSAPRATHAASAHVLVDSVMNTSENYARNQIQGHGEPSHQQQAMPATPSPPTLIREEFYNAQLTDRNGPHRIYCSTNNGYLNTADEKIHVSDSACRNKLATSMHSNYNGHFTRRSEHNSNSYYQHQDDSGSVGTEFHNPQHQYDQSGYPHHHGNQSTVAAAAATTTVKPGKEYPADRATHTTAINNNGLHRMNGTSPHPRVLSRQNDTSLSPPTLKRRLLFAQGSEGEGTAPRCMAGLSRHSDKRRNLQQHYVGHSENRQNGHVSSDGRETQTRFCRGGDVPLPAVMLCTAPAHAVSADDGLWRPW